MSTSLRFISPIFVALLLGACKRHETVATKSPTPIPQAQQTQTAAPARRSPAPDIDLIAATVNGKAIFNLGLDELTDLMGRPSSIKSAELFNKTKGVQLPYADKGLVFSCNHPDIDPRQTCEGFVIFLASTQTTEGGGPFAAFHGNLNYGLNSSWKAKDVLQAFAAYSPRDLYDPKLAALKGLAAEMEKETRRVGGRSRSSQVGSHDLLISIVMTFPDHNVGIEYEENTKFIERIIVARRESH